MSDRAAATFRFAQRLRRSILRNGAAKTFTLVATVLASGLAWIEQTAVNVVLPLLQREFDTGVAAVQWVVEAYLLFLAALLLVGGSLGDRFGRRRVFGIGVALFGAASVASALAPDLRVLVAARAAQGVGAALLVPGSLSLITANFPENERGRAFGAWAAMSGLTAAGGPVLGGLLADFFSWRAVFAMVVPLAVAILVVLPRVPESRAPESRALDPVGAALVTLGLAAVTFGLVEANRLGLRDAAVVAALAAGVALLAAFVAWEARAREPMLTLGLFRNRAFAGTNAATLLLYAALGGALFFVPFNLIQVQGWSATAAGAASLPLALLITFLSRPAGRLADRVGARLPLAVGSAVAAVGYALLARPGVDASYWTGFFPGFVVLGLGMAALVAPLTATVMSSAPESHAGVASGVNNAIARLASLLAVATFGLVAVQVFALALPADATAALGDEASRLAEAEPPADLPPEEREALSRAVADAFVAAYRALMLLAAALALAAAAILGLSVRGDPAREP